MLRNNLNGKVIVMVVFCFIAIWVTAQNKAVQVPKIKFTALDGRKVDLSKMKGKVVLIDFWATWCAPCVKEMPHVQAMYSKYRKEGFEVIGISLDAETAKVRVVKILEDNHITYPTRFTGQGFPNDPYVKEFGIKQLPTVWLLDQAGNIVDTDVRGDRLEVFIRQCLGLKALNH